MSQMTPREIVHELNRFIIGQDKAKRAVAIALRNARLALSVAVRQVIANGLNLLGVSAPEEM